MKKDTKNKHIFIPVSRPFLNARGRKYLLEAYDSRWVSSKGKYIEKFEELFAKWNHTRYGAACSSGTNALILGLRGLGIEAGDEIIVPEFTMVASAWAVSMVRAKPVFVDCGDDLLIDPAKIEKAITKKTKAIMPVHIYGRSCDMNAILAIARRHKLKVIEDSAEAHGVKPTGDVACFSLFGNKIITSGEGGICLSNNEKMNQKIKWLRSMAFNPGHTFLHEEFGYNFRMTNMEAAVALSQTEDLDHILDLRRKVEKNYDRELAPLYGKHLIPMKKRDVLWMYDIVLVDAKKRDALRDFLFKKNIDTRLFFKPMSQQPMYKNEKYKTLKAYDFSLRGFYLPTATDLSSEEIGYITGAVKEFFQKNI
jgi:perosamine synthetase